jgi:hypothetical protein
MNRQEAEAKYQDVLRELRRDGTTGADMSLGDPTAKAAYEAINELIEALPATPGLDLEDLREDLAIAAGVCAVGGHDRIAGVVRDALRRMDAAKKTTPPEPCPTCAEYGEIIKTLSKASVPASELWRKAWEHALTRAEVLRHGALLPPAPRAAPACQTCAELREALRRISAVNWGNDGDCGVTRLAEDALDASEPPAPRATHDLYKTGDADIPAAIRAVIMDSNSEVVLSLCRRCGKGERELDGPCVPRATQDARGPAVAGQCDKCGGWEKHCGCQTPSATPALQPVGMNIHEALKLAQKQYRALKGKGWAKEHFVYHGMDNQLCWGHNDKPFHFSIADLLSTDWVTTSEHPYQRPIRQDDETPKPDWIDMPERDFRKVIVREMESIAAGLRELRTALRSHRDKDDAHPEDKE